MSAGPRKEHWRHTGHGNRSKNIYIVLGGEKMKNGIGTIFEDK